MTEHPGVRRSIAGWCLYDTAMSAFNTLVITFIFSVYFARGVYGDATEGSIVWADRLALAGLITALLSPVLGSIADRIGRLKPWLAVFTLITITATALMWFVEPDAAFVPLALGLVVVANVSFEFANVFYNAMLPKVAPKGMLGRVSGWGWAAGYVGGLGCLALALVGFVQPEEPWFGLSRDSSENVRATVLLVAVWYALLALPLFLFSKDAPATGVRLGDAVGDGLAVLWSTLKQVRRYGNLLRFLIASMVYRDGLATLFIVGGLYAAGTFAMTETDILVFAIGLNITAALGAFAFGFLDDRVGSKRTVLLSLAGLIGLAMPVLLAPDKFWFIGLALGLGLFVGPAQAASRSFMARLSPPHMHTEMFGLYALSGKATVFLGPFLFARLTEAFDSQRAGMATIVLFFIIGAVLLLTVRDPAKTPG
ncbi:MAG: MFS transporter [Alphaproteobacteria bacterium]